MSQSKNRQADDYWSHFVSEPMNALLSKNDLYTRQKTATVFKSKLLQFSIQNCYSFLPIIKHVSIHPYAQSLLLYGLFVSIFS